MSFKETPITAIKTQTHTKSKAGVYLGAGRYTASTISSNSLIYTGAPDSSSRLPVVSIQGAIPNWDNVSSQMTGGAHANLIGPLLFDPALTQIMLDIAARATVNVGVDAEPSYFYSGAPRDKKTKVDFQIARLHSSIAPGFSVPVVSATVIAAVRSAWARLGEPGYRAYAQESSSDYVYSGIALARTAQVLTGWVMHFESAVLQQLIMQVRTAVMQEALMCDARGVPLVTKSTGGAAQLQVKSARFGGSFSRGAKSWAAPFTKFSAAYAIVNQDYRKTMASGSVINTYDDGSLADTLLNPPTTGLTIEILGPNGEVIPQTEPVVLLKEEVLEPIDDEDGLLITIPVSYPELIVVEDPDPKVGALRVYQALNSSPLDPETLLGSNFRSALCRIGAQSQIAKLGGITSAKLKDLLITGKDAFFPVGDTRFSKASVADSPELEHTYVTLHKGGLAKAIKQGFAQPLQTAHIAAKTTVFAGMTTAGKAGSKVVNSTGTVLGTAIYVESLSAEDAAKMWPGQSRMHRFTDNGVSVQLPPDGSDGLRYENDGLSRQGDQPYAGWYLFSIADRVSYESILDSDADVVGTAIVINNSRYSANVAAEAYELAHALALEKFNSQLRDLDVGDVYDDKPINYLLLYAAAAAVALIIFGAWFSSRKQGSESQGQGSPATAALKPATL